MTNAFFLMINDYLEDINSIVSNWILQK